MKKIIESLIFAGLAIIIFCSFASAETAKKDIKVNGSTVHYMKTDTSLGSLKTYKMNVAKMGESNLFVYFTTQLTNKYTVSMTPYDTEEQVKSRALGIGFNF